VLSQETTQLIVYLPLFFVSPGYHYLYSASPWCELASKVFKVVSSIAVPLNHVSGTSRKCDLCTCELPSEVPGSQELRKSKRRNIVCHDENKRLLGWSCARYSDKLLCTTKCTCRSGGMIRSSS
jgi:hypothetical protein